jgi:hypothetical protein
MSLYEPQSVPTLDETILRMKFQVLIDVLTGRVSRNVASFGELHNYVDANCYGGLCEEQLSDALIKHFGGRDLPSEAMPDGMMNYINNAQNEINLWISSGDMLKEYQQHIAQLHKNS